MASLAGLPSLHALSTEACGSRRLQGTQRKDEKYEALKLHAELKKAREERDFRKQELAVAKKAAATGMGWDDDLRDRWAPVRQRTRHNDEMEMDDEMLMLREERQRQEEQYEEQQRVKEAEYNLYKTEEEIKALEEKVAELQRRISAFEMEKMEETLEAQAPKGWRPAK